MNCKHKYSLTDRVEINLMQWLKETIIRVLQFFLNNLLNLRS